MNEDLNGRLAQAKQQLERWKDLKASLPSAQERLNHENYRLRQIETCLADAERQVQSLEAFSLSNLIQALLGRKEQRLHDYREEAEKLETERDQAAEALMAMDADVREIEQQLTALGDPQRVLQQLCDRKQAMLLESDCEAAARLQQLLAELEVAKGRRRELQKALQVGRHVLERLQAMAGSLGRARSKMLHGGPLGAIGNTAVNAVVRHVADGSVDRVREKLGEFASCMKALDLSEATDLDLEIARLGAVMEGWQAELAGNWAGKFDCDRTAVLPILEQVQAALGHLESKLDRVAPRIDQLEQERVALIECV